MNITPERMLELIELIEERATLFENFFGDMTQEAVVKYREISACLKSYAEIAPKWQAVLDAEPLGILVNVPDNYLVTWDEQAMLRGYQGTCQLIIKPAL